MAVRPFSILYGISYFIDNAVCLFGGQRHNLISIAALWPRCVRINSINNIKLHHFDEFDGLVSSKINGQLPSKHSLFTIHTHSDTGNWFWTSTDGLECNVGAVDGIALNEIVRASEAARNQRSAKDISHSILFIVYVRRWDVFFYTENCNCHLYNNILYIPFGCKRICCDVKPVKPSVDQ